MSKSPTKMTDQELEAAVKKLAPAPQVVHYERKAAQLALEYASIRQCYHCGNPTLHPYQCFNDACPNPGDPDGYEARSEREKYHFELQKRLALRVQEAGLNLGAGI